MNTILDIGLFFGAFTFIAYLIVLGIVLFEFASAYVNGRLPIRPRVVNWIFQKPFYMYSAARNKYKQAGQDPDQALTGEYAAAITAGGFIGIVAMVVVWPIILILLVLKLMREYNTNERFHEFVDNLLERDAQPKKKENSLKGFD